MKPLASSLFYLAAFALHPLMGGNLILVNLGVAYRSGAKAKAGV